MRKQQIGWKRERDSANAFQKKPTILHKRHWGLATTSNPDPDGSVPTLSHY